MIRTLLLLALVLAAFAGGVYCGIKLEAYWMRNNPDKIAELIKDPQFRKTMTETAADKANRIKDILLEGF
jgi:hypothetical protein